MVTELGVAKACQTGAPAQTLPLLNRTPKMTAIARDPPAAEVVNKSQSTTLILPREMQRQTYPIMYEVEETHWWFVGKRRIIASFVEQAIASRLANSRARLLDVGCGTGANLLMLNQFGNAEGMDVSEDALAFCRARGLKNVKRGAAEKLPYDDCSFDVVTALDVLEHLDDDVGCLREMRRVLKPGGRAIIFVPAFMFLWSAKDEVVHHRRRYRLSQLQQAVCAAGFEIERATYANLIFFAPILLSRALLRAVGARIASEEESINISTLNGVLGRILSAERHWLRYMNLPFGVSALCVARRAA